MKCWACCAFPETRNLALVIDSGSQPRADYSIFRVSALSVGALKCLKANVKLLGTQSDSQLLRPLGWCSSFWTQSPLAEEGGGALTLSPLSVQSVQQVQWSFDSVQ